MGTRIRTATAVAALTVLSVALAEPASAGTPASPSGASQLGVPRWQLTPTGVTARFRGLSAISRNVAWVAGTEGTVLRTLDGGRTWQDVSPPGAETLQLRDIEAFDARHAVVLSIGTGTDSRIYRTEDGGASWRLAFGNTDEAAFYDCVAFSDSRHGLALSDPVDGRFRVLATDDGGRSWRLRPAAGMPAALDGEFAFAASGTCLVAGPGGQAWFATGGGAQARVFRSTDGGRSWRVTATPMASGPSAGIYSLAFRDGAHGVAVGGDFTTPDTADRAAATTSDGGRTWTLVRADRAPAGYRSGAAWLPLGLPFALAVGPTGSELSLDAGRTWRGFDTGSFDSVQCGGWGGCWASGEQGRVARLG